MNFRETVERLRAVRRRIQEKNYPMPTNIYLPNNWEIDSLDARKVEVALKEYEEYEKRVWMRGGNDFVVKNRKNRRYSHYAAYPPCS